METMVTPVALAVWARQFAALVNVGVNLMHCLHVLQEASDEPLTSVTRDMAERIEAGETLSGCMMEHPEVFNRLSISLCRAGEVGGVLDETFALWADWLERDLEFRVRLDMYALLAQLQRPERSRDDLEAGLRAALPDLDDRVREMTFCRMVGMMLGSGVPVIQTLQTAFREIYPERAEQAAALGAAIRAGERMAGPLHEMGFSGLTVQLCAIGEECGTLDRTMEKAADLFQRELEIRLSAAMAATVSPARSEEEAS